MSFNKMKFKKSARITYSVFWNLTLIIIIFGLIVFSFAGGVGAGYFASLVKDEPIRSYDSMKKDIYNYEETTELYFSDNIYLGKLRSDLYRDEVSLEDVSKYLKEAVIATEDEYFYEHQGVVPKAILRAIFQEFTNSSVKSGGSTLTQQLIKNQILTNEVSFERKAKEIMLALRLERFFDKEEILEAYLNVVPFGRNSSGRNIAGVQAAAQGIFGVNASELNLPQAAYIAGLPQSPFGYTPFTQKGEIKESIEPSISRMKTVLNRMLAAGYITKQEYDEAMDYDIQANLTPPKPSPVQKYPWLTFEIEKRATEVMATVLAEQDGYTEEDLKKDENLENEYQIKADRTLRQNGYKIYTTIDKNIYDKMQLIKNNYEYYGNDKPETIVNSDGEQERILEPVEVGAMLIENSSGKIISFIGGRDHQREQLNHATTGKRSNGSTMKPLLVYAPALELGIIQPSSVIADVKVGIKAGTKLWEPENYGGNYHGLTSARYALARSYNVPAAKIYTQTINENPTSYLEKMGFTSLTKGDASHLSMALGALDNGVTIEENVNAYATFANEGKFVDSYMIEKIVSKDGDVVYEHKSKAKEVFTPQTAYLTLDMMRDVIRHGTAAGIPSKLKFKTDWAGKTGTSQDYRDAWFVATNPKVTFGVWMGYDTPKSLEKSYKGYSYSQRNQKLWAEIMNATYDLNPDLVSTEEYFKMPGGIVRRSYCAVSGLLPSELCEELGLIKTDIFNAEFIPKEKDNSLEKIKYVTINNKNYRALEATPIEFTSEGITISQEFITERGLEDLEDLSQIFPKREVWNNIILTESKQMEENGIIPGQVGNVQLVNGNITWDKHLDEDVIGYQVFKGSSPFEPFTKVASISSASEQLSHQATSKDSLYYVVAVDIIGNKSTPSSIVGLSNFDDSSDPGDKDKEKQDGNNDIDDPITNPPGEQNEEAEIPNKENEKQKKQDKPKNSEEDILDPLNEITN